ncbi:MAG: ATP-dependent 6-phosphofructokinase [Bacteroidota bacterium]
MKKKLLILTGGGDCPGLNAVIRAVVKSAQLHGGWEVFGSIEAYTGLLLDPMEIIPLGDAEVRGIHIRGGTILGTTNKGGPFDWPVEQADGTWQLQDRSEFLLAKLKELEIDAVISIGGDGSQKISQQLFEMGMPVVGVPKTIDNDLSSTDYTFGFQTAVQVATEAFDKLVTTAESHSRIMIMEVMGRDAGWIALHTAIAGGAEICLIPEIPYHIDSVMERIRQRYQGRRGFVNIVVSEGAKPKGGEVITNQTAEVGYQYARLGGVGFSLKQQIQDTGWQESIRVSVLGHLQRGGTPIAFDRILATQFGVKAFDMVCEEKFGRMAAYQEHKIVDVSLADATASYNFIKADSFLIETARKMDICLGD